MGLPDAINIVTFLASDLIFILRQKVFETTEAFGYLLLIKSKLANIFWQSFLNVDLGQSELLLLVYGHQRILVVHELERFGIQKAATLC